MMRTLARSLAIILVICLQSHAKSSDEPECSKEFSPQTIAQWLGVKELPKPSIKDLADVRPPVKSWLEESYFSPRVYRSRPGRCSFLPGFDQYLTTQIPRFCCAENSQGLAIKALFFGDSLLASCPSLNRDLPGLEECQVSKNLEFFKSPELEPGQPLDATGQAPRFHSEIHALLQARALFKIADVFGSDAERSLKPVSCRPYGRGHLDRAAQRMELSALTTDRFKPSSPFIQCNAIAIESSAISTEVYAPVILMDSNLDELLVTLSKLVVVSDPNFLTVLGYPKWSVRANLHPALVYSQPMVYRCVIADTRVKYATQDVWSSAPLLCMVISDALLEDADPPKFVFEQDEPSEPRKTRSLLRREPSSQLLASRGRGFLSR